ncbi:MAG: YncE family protein [Candidatus Eremiobacteraeota bacterium]|nr:YncE family protein [Candidatus Eremiobacteraeota bacterium]MBC5828320.1 YncE family protein [Candidatus Eremiobacteraeota bacterium]
MMGIRAMLAAWLLAFSLVSPSHVAASSGHALPLRLVTDIPVRAAGAALGRPTLRMDYETIDPLRRMLYVAYLGAGEIIVFNLDSNEVVAHIQNLPGVHGTLAIPDLHRLYASATGVDQVASIDQRTLKVTARAAGGDYPDGIAYDPDDHRIFVSDEHGATDTVVDTNTNKTLETINLGGEVGNTQYDSKARRVYSDVQTRNQVVAINPTTDRVVARYALPGCNHDHGLMLDVRRRLAFIACDGNARLLVMDIGTWKERATYPVGDGPDVMALDEGLGRLYVAAESGIVSIFQESGRTLEPIGRAFLANEAHTVAVDPVTHLVYFALQNVSGRPVIRVMAPATSRRTR